MILSCQHITKAFLENTVLSDVTFHLEKGDKAALVGINGAGKSTLLRIIIGEMAPDEGSVSFQRDTTWGYLAQNQNLDTDNTIYEELLTVKKDLVDLEQKLALDEKLMAELTGEEQARVVEEYNTLMERYKAENGFAYKGEITGVLRGLGFADEETGQKISTLSGGQKTRVALAKLLLEKPDLIMLDEPTNHLDIGSIQWLETYLSNYRGTVLVVSHDRYFLDKCVTKVIELENGHATLFPGNYSWYAERKKALREEAWHQYLNNQAEIRHQEEVISKLRQFNREKSIRRAESREKMLAKTTRLDRPVELRDNMHLVLRPSIRSGRDVCDVRHLSKSFEGRHLFDDVTFQLQRGEHVAIIGSNGTGKSTLLKMIIGQLKPDEGTVTFGTNVHIGYYDQEHHVLHDDNTLFEEISDEHPDMTNTEIRTLLASFLFTNDDVFKYIRDLSGGEKGRLSLAKLMLSEANFLLLDEPTNHLDMVSKEVLENALNSYEGTVLYVSHDRYFINHTASRILSLTDRLLLNYPGNNEQTAPACYTGNYDLYLMRSASAEPALIAADIRRMADDGYTYTPEVFDDRRKTAASEPAAKNSGEDTSASSAPGALTWQQQKEQAAAERRKKNALEKCEAAISRLEQRNAAIDEEMALPQNATDLTKLTALQKEKDSNTAALDPLYEEWEQLQE